MGRPKKSTEQGAKWQHSIMLNVVLPLTGRVYVSLTSSHVRYVKKTKRGEYTITSTLSVIDEQFQEMINEK